MSVEPASANQRFQSSIVIRIPYLPAISCMINAIYETAIMTNDGSDKRVINALDLKSVLKSNFDHSSDAIVTLTS